MEHLTPHIDAVIAWVDGNDPVHRRKRSKALTEERHVSQVSTGSDETRFIDNGEIEYCILAIRKFAPWIRTILLVTDNQTPAFLTPELRDELDVRMVDHRDIFESYESALPTFNTRTIESALWRIPGLAPRFIYFNDDMILTRPVEPTQFFQDDNVVLRGRWNRIKHYGAIRMTLSNIAGFLTKHLLGITRTMHLLMQIKSAQLAGFEKEYFRGVHVPHPIRTETLREFFDEQPDLFEANIKYKFRNTEQFSAIFLANHLEIAAEQAILQTPSDVVDLDGEIDNRLTIRRKLEQIRTGKIQSVCLQAFEKFKPRHRQEIIHTLDELLKT